MGDVDSKAEEEKKLYEAEIETLRNLGAVIIDPADIESAGELNGYDVLIYEFKSDMNAYLSTLGSSAPVKTLQDIIDYNNDHREAALKYGQTILLQSEAVSGNLTEPEYINARLKDIRLSTVEGIDKVIKEHNLDALLFPSSWGCGMAAKAGYPSIAVPAGYTSEGEPFGITFSAGAFSEPILIKLAYAYEQGTRKRVPPKL
jgi:amidase